MNFSQYCQKASGFLKKLGPDQREVILACAPQFLEGNRADHVHIDTSVRMISVNTANFHIHHFVMSS